MSPTKSKTTKSSQSSEVLHLSYSTSNMTYSSMILDYEQPVPIHIDFNNKLYCRVESQG